MKDILIFSHNYLVNNWYEIVSEQLSLLKTSELYQNSSKIYYCAYSDDNFEVYSFINLVKKYDLDKKILITIFPFNDREKDTLVLLQEIVKNYEDANILYYHTKGVTAVKNYSVEVQKNIVSWRNIMNYHNIEKWKNAIAALDDGHDMYGVLYSTYTINGINGYPDRSVNFYAGNFWWCTSKHINKLPSAKMLDNYKDVESFITSIPHKWANTPYPTEGNIYLRYFDPQTYRKDNI